MMQRREFISKTTKGAGLLICGSMFITANGCTDASKPFNELFTQKEVDLLNQLADVIIPETDSPGGKAAKVGEFIASVMKDCATEEEQSKFKKGLSLIDQRSKEISGNEFLDCTTSEQTNIAQQLDQEEKEYFPAVKSWIVSGYLTSEIGATQFLKYPQVPGRYDGCTAERPW